MVSRTVTVDPETSSMLNWGSMGLDPNRMNYAYFRHYHHWSTGNNLPLFPRYVLPRNLVQLRRSCSVSSSILFGIFRLLSNLQAYSLHLCSRVQINALPSSSSTNTRSSYIFMTVSSVSAPNCQYIQY